MQRPIISVAPIREIGCGPGTQPDRRGLVRFGTRQGRRVSSARFREASVAVERALVAPSSERSFTPCAPAISRNHLLNHSAIAMARRNPLLNLQFHDDEEDDEGHAGSDNGYVARVPGEHCITDEVNT